MFEWQAEYGKHCADTQITSAQDKHFESMLSSESIEERTPYIDFMEILIMYSPPHLSVSVQISKEYILTNESWIYPDTVHVTQANFKFWSDLSGHHSYLALRLSTFNLSVWTKMAGIKSPKQHCAGAVFCQATDLDCVFLTSIQVFPEQWWGAFKL